jgi:hypothetical protein
LWNIYWFTERCVLVLMMIVIVTTSYYIVFFFYIVYLYTMINIFNFYQQMTGTAMQLWLLYSTLNKDGRIFNFWLKYSMTITTYIIFVVKLRYKRDGVFITLKFTHLLMSLISFSHSRYPSSFVFFLFRSFIISVNIVSHVGVNPGNPPFWGQ